MGKPSYLSIVQQVRAGLVAQGVNLDQDDCSRFEVTKRAASLIAQIEPQIGLLSKPSGANCDGFATDILCWTDGTIIDVLGAGPDGPNTAQWLENPTRVDPTRWRAAPSGAQPPAPLPSPNPPPSPPPPSPSVEVQPLIDRLDLLDATVHSLLGLSNDVMVLRQQLATLADHVAHLETRRYVAKYWGLTIVSNPE